MLPEDALTQLAKSDFKNLQMALLDRGVKKKKNMKMWQKVMFIVVVTRMAFNWKVFAGLDDASWKSVDP